MSPNSEEPLIPLTLESLAQSTAFTLRVHADMIVSIDTHLESISANFDKLADKVDKLAETTRRNSENIQALTEHAAHLDLKFDKLAELMTGLFQRHDERITALEQKK